MTNKRENSLLFSEFNLRELTLRNRIVMSPMCMYSADEDGRVSDWHLLHYPTRAVGGVGMIIVEATAVEPRGRISANDLGIWSDEHVSGLKKLNGLCHHHGVKTAIQLAHAGRKCGVAGTTPISATDEAFDENYAKPKLLGDEEIPDLVSAFCQAAERAEKAGFDAVEIHSAHGYLINQFISPLTNRRSGRYGGNFEKRVLFLKEVVQGVRNSFPQNKPVFVRLSAVDHVAGGIELDDTIKIIDSLKERVDLWDLSSGGIASMKIKPYYGYQIPYSQSVKRKLGVSVGAVGMIRNAELAEEIIANKRADLVLLGRELLWDPYWPMHAASKLNAEIEFPKQYRSLKIYNMR